MADGPPSKLTHYARKAYKSLFGGDINLPLEGSPAAMAAKKKQDEQMREGARTLGSLLKKKTK